jgi:flagellin
MLKPTRTLGRSGSTSLADIGTGGALNLVSGDVAGAQSAIRSAISRVSSERGRMGAFQRNTLASTKATLESARVNIASANSLIRDTDFAFETASLAGSLVIRQAALGAIGATLRQRASVLDILA